MGANIDDLVEELRNPCRALVDAASAAGLQPRITSTFRSHAEQQRLYRRFLAGQQGFPVAPPGSSSHEYGEAFDMVVSPMDALADVGYTWQTWGGGWNPADAVHFELPGASASHAGMETGTQISLRDWIMQEYNAIPWWLSVVMPLETTLQPATSSKQTYIKKLIGKLGLT